MRAWTIRVVINPLRATDAKTGQRRPFEELLRPKSKLRSARSASESGTAESIFNIAMLRIAPQRVPARSGRL